MAGWIDCKGLLPMKDYIPQHTDVLNGIAYDPATKRLWVTGKFLRQEFERHEAVKPRVFRLVDHTHTSTTEFLEDAIVGNCPTEDGRGMGH